MSEDAEIRFNFCSRSHSFLGPPYRKAMEGWSKMIELWFCWGCQAAPQEDFSEAKSPEALLWNARRPFWEIKSCHFHTGIHDKVSLWWKTSQTTCLRLQTCSLQRLVISPRHERLIVFRCRQLKTRGKPQNGQTENVLASICGKKGDSN